MRFSFTNIRRLVTGLAITGALIGCGTSTSNDQGVSFSLLGYFASVPSAGSTDVPPALSAISVPLTDANPETPPSGNSLGAGTVLAAVGLQNNLVAQVIRTDQVFFDYFVPGAAAQPPSTNYPLSFLLGAAPSASDNPPSSTLPGGFNGLVNTGYVQVPVLSADIRAWIALNRDLLPAAPFSMQVTTYVSGVTSAGDRYESNAASLLIQFVDDNIISPTEGSPVSESSGSGGDPSL